MHFPSVALIASALMTCTTLVTGYAFAPALFPLRAPGAALRTASESCLTKPPRALRGAAAGGLSALSTTAEQDRTLAAHEALITELQQMVGQQNRTIAGLQRRVEARTKIFNWDDHSWNETGRRETRGKCFTEGGRLWPWREPFFQATICSVHPSSGSVDLEGSCMSGDVRVNKSLCTGVPRS